MIHSELKQMFTLAELSQIQIALSSRIEFINAVIGTCDEEASLYFVERLTAQQQTCVNVLERIRGEA